eukprot:g6904.t1 g6904   contig23:1455586-1456474(-)
MSFLRPLSTLFRAGTRPTVSASTSITTSGVINGSPSALLLPTHRSKHSATQVKRLFKKNPARLRIQRRNEQQLAATEGDASTTNTSRSSSNNNATTKIPQRSYPPVFKPTFLQNGWSAPPPADVEVPVYPFRVRRTGRKPFGAAGFLPVYRDVRIHGTKHTTIIRNVQGDISAFLTELRAVLALPLPKKGILTSMSNTNVSSPKHGGGEAGRGVNAENPIRIRAGNTIEVNGDWSREVKRWLAGLGF